MLIVQKRRYKKKHVVGGSGFFDSVAKIFGKVTSSAVGKTVGNVAAKAASSEAVKNFVKSAGETASKELGSRAAKKIISAVLDDSRAKSPRLTNTGAPVEPTFAVPSTPTTRQAAAVTQEAPLLNNNLTARIIEKLLGTTPSHAATQRNAAAKYIIKKFVDARINAKTPVNVARLIAGNGIKNIVAEVY